MGRKSIHHHKKTRFKGHAGQPDGPISAEEIMTTMKRQQFDLELPRVASVVRRPLANGVRGRVAYILAIVGLAIALAVPAFGQVVGGAISGTVRDQTGAVLPGATVSIQNVETGFVRDLTAEDAGHYVAPSIPVGRYKI